MNYENKFTITLLFKNETENIVMHICMYDINISSLVQVVGKCLADGADEYLQILSLCSVIMQQASQNS